MRGKHYSELPRSSSHRDCICSDTTLAKYSTNNFILSSLSTDEPLIFPGMVINAGCKNLLFLKGARNGASMLLMQSPHSAGPPNEKQQRLKAEKVTYLLFPRFQSLVKYHNIGDMAVFNSRESSEIEFGTILLKN